jgi:phosphate transport system permease protein
VTQRMPYRDERVRRPRVGRGIRISEFMIETLIRVLGFSTIGFVLLIFLFLLREGLPTFLQVPLTSILSTKWYPTFGLFGTLPLLFGSVLVTLLSIIIALPLGVATAVFVREVAPGGRARSSNPSSRCSREYPPWSSASSA